MQAKARTQVLALVIYHGPDDSGGIHGGIYADSRFYQHNTR
jgi:hypothetical protein